MSEKERLQLENELLMTCSKAQAINKYIDALEENSKLSELWCDSRAKIRELENQQKEFMNFLENEKDRLARECSQIYEDDLGKTRLVNEDIFNEVNKISSKYKSVIGASDE